MFLGLILLFIFSLNSNGPLDICKWYNDDPLKGLQDAIYFIRAFTHGEGDNVR